MSHVWIDLNILISCCNFHYVCLFRLPLQCEMPNIYKPRSCCCWWLLRKVPKALLGVQYVLCYWLQGDKIILNLQNDFIALSEPGFSYGSGVPWPGSGAWDERWPITHNLLLPLCRLVVSPPFCFSDSGTHLKVRLEEFWFGQGSFYFGRSLQSKASSD